VARLLKYQCACQCGRSTFTVSGRPLTRLYCHCEICNALYRQPRADVTIWWGTSVEFPDNQRIQFKHYRLPPAINRGTCPSCGMPVVGFLRIAPFVQLAFVPAMNFPRGIPATEAERTHLLSPAVEGCARPAAQGQRLLAERVVRDQTGPSRNAGREVPPDLAEVRPRVGSPAGLVSFCAGRTASFLENCCDRSWNLVEDLPPGRFRFDGGRGGQQAWGTLGALAGRNWQQTATRQANRALANY